MYFGSLWILVRISLAHIMTLFVCSLWPTWLLLPKKKILSLKLACGALTKGIPFGPFCPSQWHLCAKFQGSVRRLDFNPHLAPWTRSLHSHLHWPGSEVVHDKWHIWLGGSALELLFTRWTFQTRSKSHLRDRALKDHIEFTSVDTNACIE